MNLTGKLKNIRDSSLNLASMTQRVFVRKNLPVHTQGQVYHIENIIKVLFGAYESGPRGGRGL